MKNLHFFTKPMLVITMLFFFTGCEDLKKKAEYLTSGESSLEETAKPHAENALIVVQDESASVNYDESEKKSIQKFLKKFFYNEIQPSTDIIILQIGDQATSKSIVNYKKIEWKIFETKDDSFKTDADRILEDNNKRQQDQSHSKQYKSNSWKLLNLPQRQNRKAVQFWKYFRRLQSKSSLLNVRKF